MAQPITDDQIVEMLYRKLVDRSQTALAREMNISVSYLHDVLVGRTPPGPLVLKFFGYERIETIVVKR